MSEAEREQAFADYSAWWRDAARASAELAAWTSSPQGQSALLEDPDLLAEARTAAEAIKQFAESARSTIAGSLGPRLPRLRILCPRCGVTITSATPSTSYAIEHEAPRYLVPVGGGPGRWLDASPPGARNTRVRLVCPRRRCGRTAIVTMPALVNRFVAAINAGRSELVLDL